MQNFLVMRELRSETTNVVAVLLLQCLQILPPKLVFEVAAEFVGRDASRDMKLGASNSVQRYEIA